MLTFILAGAETALHMGILAGAFFSLFGKEEYKREKRPGLWLWSWNTVLPILSSV